MCSIVEIISLVLIINATSATLMIVLGTALKILWLEIECQIKPHLFHAGLKILLSLSLSNLMLT
jgi:hypothetical protein